MNDLRTESSPSFSKEAPPALASYTNSVFDRKQSGKGTRSDDEQAVKRLYEFKPYPDLGASLKSIALYTKPIEKALEARTKVRYLDIGCGTGHYLVGVAKDHPQWECQGLELAHASAEIARQLAKRHNTPNVKVNEGSYLDEWPFPEKSFDVISALGTIHHCADPLAAMKACHRYLRDDGYLLLHLYGWRLDSKKFDLKEILSVFEPNLFNYEKRFQLYQEYMKHKKGRWLHRIARLSLLDIYKMLQNGFRNLRRKANQVSWSPGWTVEYKELSAPWADHFCHPCERAYEVPQIKDLVESSGFEIVSNLGQGRDFPDLIPEPWKKEYQGLDVWDKMRLSELLTQEGGSFRLVLRKKRDFPSLQKGPATTLQ